VLAVVRSRLSRFGRCLQLAAFAGGFVLAAAALLLAGTCAVVAARIGGWPLPEPRLPWLALLLVPLAFGFLHARRSALPPSALAAHLDQRLALDGLLLASAETASTAWQERLEERAAAADGGLPSLRWGLLARRVLPPAVLFAGVCWLPERSMVPPVNPSIAQALRDVEAAIELAKQEAGLPEEKLEELEQRAEELIAGMAAGKDATWADVDELQARLQQERLLQQDALQKAVHAAKALQEAARNAGKQSPSGAAPDLEAQLRELLQHAAAAGLLDKGAPGPDPSQASRAGDAEDLARLAEALAETALEKIEARPGIAGEAVEDLEALLRGMREGGKGDGDTPGRGGIDRGPGHATLELTEDFDGDTSALGAHKLPPGRVLPQDWEVMQTRRIDPEVAPVRNEAPGGVAAGGAGEAAWRRRLSPSHRAVVREFFSSRHGSGNDKR